MRQGSCTYRWTGNLCTVTSPSLNLSKKHFMFLEQLVSVYLVNLNFLGCFKISKFHVKIRIGITICNKRDTVLILNFFNTKNSSQYWIRIKTEGLNFIVLKIVSTVLERFRVKKIGSSFSHQKNIVLKRFRVKYFGLSFRIKKSSI